MHPVRFKKVSLFLEMLGSRDALAVKPLLGMGLAGRVLKLGGAVVHVQLAGIMPLYILRRLFARLP